MTGEPADNALDRRPPIAFLLSAESFLKTAIHAHQATEARTLKLRFDAPIYYLYSHAIELTLKAYLRAKGVAAEELPTHKWGHSLSKLWSGCIERGLVLDSATHDAAVPVVDMLAPLARSYEFRYVKVGFRGCRRSMRCERRPRCCRLQSSPQSLPQFRGRFRSVGEGPLVERRARAAVRQALRRSGAGPPTPFRTAKRPAHRIRSHFHLAEGLAADVADRQTAHLPRLRRRARRTRRVRSIL